MTRRDDTSLVSLDEIVEVLRAHEGPPQPITNGASKRVQARPRYQRAALLGVAVAVALLVGSGLGFGLGSSVTPSSSARDNLVGFGFLPARSWNVVQSGEVGAGTKGHAVAANVPLRETGRARLVPYATLESLPSGGIVISATFALRGDPGEDFKYRVDALPLRVADALPVPVAGSGALPATVTHYRLRVAVGGSNIDVHIFFGTQPTPQATAAAQAQLERLVVASDDVTIGARPAIVPSDHSTTLFGTVASGKAEEEVVIQAKDCGQSFFRTVAGTTTHEGGVWSLEYFPGITSAVRAVWNGRASSQVTLRQRAMLRFSPKASDRTRFVVSVVAIAQFWKKKVVIQRFDRRLGRWQAYRTVVLTEQASPGAWTWTSGELTARLPKGTRLRAVLPAKQARPCYLSGTSLPVRT